MPNDNPHHYSNMGMNSQLDKGGYRRSEQDEEILREKNAEVARLQQLLADRENEIQSLQSEAGSQAGDTPSKPNYLPPQYPKYAYNNSLPGVMTRVQPQGQNYTPQESTGFEQQPMDEPTYQPRVGIASAQKPPSQQVKSQVYDFGAQLPAQVQYQESPAKPSEQPQDYMQSQAAPMQQFYGYGAELPSRSNEVSYQQYQPPPEQDYQAQYEQYQAIQAAQEQSEPASNQQVHPGAYPPEYAQNYQQMEAPQQEQPASRPAVHPGAFPPGFNSTPQDKPSNYSYMQTSTVNNPSYEEQAAAYQRNQANENMNMGNATQEDVRNMSEEELRAKLAQLDQMEKQAADNRNMSQDSNQPGPSMQEATPSQYVAGSMVYNYGPNPVERYTKKAPKTRVANPITGAVLDTSEFSPGYMPSNASRQQPQVATQQLQFGGEPRFTRANPKVMSSNPITGQNSEARRPPQGSQLQEYGNMAMRR